MIDLCTIRQVFEALEHLRNYCQVCKLREIAGKLQTKQKKSIVAETRTALFQVKLGPKIDFLTGSLNTLVTQSTKEALTLFKTLTTIGQEGDAPSFCMTISEIIKNRMKRTGFSAIKSISDIRLKKIQPSYKKLNALQKLRKHKQLSKALQTLFFLPFLRRSMQKIKVKSQFERRVEGLLILKDLVRVAARRTTLTAFKLYKPIHPLPQRQSETKPSSLKVVSVGTTSTHVSERFV